MMVNKKLFFMLVFVFLLAGCDLPLKQDKSSSLRIMPQECELTINESIAFSLQGTQDAGASPTYTWMATAGSILSLKDGVTAEYTAPATPTKVVISVEISVPGEETQTITTSCNIVDPEAVKKTEMAMLPTPARESGSDVTASPLPTRTGTLGQIIISEVMVDVCGGDDYRRFNQYIELYNKGDVPVDLKDLWIYSPNSDYRGQKLVTWAQRNPNEYLGEQLITDSTILQPRQTALILPPQYGHAPRPYDTPYRIPDGTLILTVSEDIRLGDHFYAIRNNAVIVLYKGGRMAMEGNPVSTYGTPRINSKYLRDVYDDGADNLPRSRECYSMERVSPNAPDATDNWHMVYNGSPGDYVP